MHTLTDNLFTFLIPLIFQCLICITNFKKNSMLSNKLKYFIQYLEIINNIFLEIIQL
jgi:hypothetical protein